MGILKFLVKRIISIIITISLIIIVGYVMMYYAPGSYFSASSIAGALGNLALQDPKLAAKIVQQFEDRYGMNLPLWHQIWNYLVNSFTFNFGNSFENPSVTIISTLQTAFPISVILSVGSVLLSIIVGIPLGILAALKRNTWIDSALTTFSIMGSAIPAFVSAVLLVLIFGVLFPGTIPVNGWGQPADAILPIIALSLGNIGGVTRYMRGSLIEGLRQEYIRTAEAKGVRYWSIIWKHGIRNSLTALITVVGPQFAFTVVGTVWVEGIFSIPGLGSLIGNAFNVIDYPLAITEVFILALMVMGMNLLVDLCYGLLDPRVKLE